MTPDELLELATARHRDGDLAAARRLYARICAVDPDHATALFRSGLLELQDGRPEPALSLIARAVAIASDVARHHVGLGQVLQTLGRYEAAAAAYRQALSLQPDSFAALNNLGSCLQRCGRFAEAASAYREALAHQPNQAGAMANLGTVLQALGRVDEAVALLRAAVELEPQTTAHAVNLGIALCRRRDFGAAHAVLADVLERDAANPDAAFNLGNALSGLGRPQEAAECFCRAADLRPGHADALINLGNMRKAMGEFTAAASAYESALEAEPHSVAALNNAGCLLRALGRLDAAEDMLRRGLQVEPNHAVLHDNLGSVLKDAGDLDAAIACFRRSLELDATNPITHGNLAYALNFECAAPEPILEECRRWGRRFADPLRPAARAHRNERSPQRRLRIGYVSPDFRDHCQTLFTTPLLSQHDHAGFEIVCYSSVARPDEHSRRLRGLADRWCDARALDDAALADAIRADGIDILVDLTMHMAAGRPLMFARKPAPLQVAWLAYPGTSGNAAMDYRLSDPYLDPPGAERHYSERTLRLPDSFWCYDPLTTEPAVNRLPALERGFLTLGCLNNPCKLSDATLRLWAGVLTRLADSRLTLLAPSGRHRTQLCRRLEVQGIETARVDFLTHRPRADYLRAYHGIDLGLDTFPYNGHTTSLDALWMGVPTVSRVGNTCVGRGGLSQLKQLGLAELAADTDRGFIDAAVALGEDLPRLAELRRGLRRRLELSPLMDAPRFARHMEDAYRRIWSRYCAQGSAVVIP